MLFVMSFYVILFCFSCLMPMQVFNFLTAIAAPPTIVHHCCVDNLIRFNYFNSSTGVPWLLPRSWAMQQWRRRLVTLQATRTHYYESTEQQKVTMRAILRPLENYKTESARAELVGPQATLTPRSEITKKLCITLKNITIYLKRFVQGLSVAFSIIQN